MYTFMRVHMSMYGRDAHMDICINLLISISNSQTRLRIYVHKCAGLEEDLAQTWSGPATKLKRTWKGPGTDPERSLAPLRPAPLPSPCASPLCALPPCALPPCALPQCALPHCYLPDVS